MLSFWIRHRYRFFSGGEGEPFCQISCDAVNDHLSWPFYYFNDHRMDSDHRSSCLPDLDFEPHPMAHLND